MTILMPMGGALSVTRPAVLEAFVQQAGGKRASILILPQASALADTGAYYEKLFIKLGVKRAVALGLKTRAQLDVPQAATALKGITGIFMAGGNQMRLTTLLGGTQFFTAMRRVFDAGCVVAGTSAGAAVMSQVMIAYGKSGSTPRDKLVQCVPGFGLSSRFAFDQHFRQRDRLGRLLYLIAAHPGFVGLGIDEDTAAIINDDRMVQVVGSGAVTIVDASAMRGSDIAEHEKGEPIAMSNIRVDILTNGCTYNLRTRKAHIPAPPLLLE